MERKRNLSKKNKENMRKLFTFIIGLLGLNAFSACANANYGNENVDAFDSLINQKGIIVLDVRTASEYAEGHIPGAVNIDVKQDNFMTQVEKLLDKSKTIAVYCRSGRRSANAADMMTQRGYKVVNLKGGILAWKAENKPVNNVEVDAFMTPGGKTVTICALIHASLRICFDGTEIEIDPVRQLRERKVDYTVYPKADYLFVTHEHADHFDKEAIKLLSADSTQVITNKRCADMLGYGTVMANGDQRSLSDRMKVEAVPAYNNTEGHLQFHPKGRDNGYVITLDGLRIYVAGDTEDIEEMAAIKDIDIAFLPCNQPFTMTTAQLVKAARIVKPKVLFPYHYGDTDLSGVTEDLKADGIDVRIRHYE